MQPELQTEQPAGSEQGGSSQVFIHEPLKRKVQHAVELTDVLPEQIVMRRSKSQFKYFFFLLLALR